MYLLFLRPIIAFGWEAGLAREGDGLAGGRNRLRWYHPRLRRFEWREMPDEDDAALALLRGYAGAESDVAVYRGWRGLGASVAASLIRAGEAGKERDGSRPS
jgi:hypothetical protein